MSEASNFEKICKGYSAKAKKANWCWVALITVCVVYVVSKDNPEKILPWFYETKIYDVWKYNLMIWSMLFVTTMAYMSAFSQMQVVRKLILETIDGSTEKHAIFYSVSEHYWFGVESIESIGQIGLFVGNSRKWFISLLKIICMVIAAGIPIAVIALLFAQNNIYIHQEIGVANAVFYWFFQIITMFIFAMLFAVQDNMYEKSSFTYVTYVMVVIIMIMVLAVAFGRPVEKKNFTWLTSKIGCSSPEKFIKNYLAAMERAPEGCYDDIKMKMLLIYYSQQGIDGNVLALENCFDEGEAFIKSMAPLYTICKKEPSFSLAHLASIENTIKIKHTQYYYEFMENYCKCRYMK